MLSWYWRRRKQKVKKKTSKRLDKEWITVGHIPDALAEILFPLMKTEKIYSTKAMIAENHRATLEGKRVPSGCTGIPCNYELFGLKKFKKIC